MSADKPLAERCLEPVPAGRAKETGPSIERTIRKNVLSVSMTSAAALKRSSNSSRKKSCTDFFMLYMARSPFLSQASRIQCAQFVQFVVKSLLVHQIGSLGIPFHSLHLQLVLLCPVLVHVKGLAFENRMRAFHDR